MPAAARVSRQRLSFPARTSQTKSHCPGEVSTSDGKNGGRLCLGFSKTISAFGGVGKAVVAAPCASAEGSTAWELRPATNGTGAFLQLQAAWVADKTFCLANKR